MPVEYTINYQLYAIDYLMRYLAKLLDRSGVIYRRK
ncbi:hypothetical protein T02_12061 [Trichinella nativa]|uniref:Uncharacterized protein n=1 Tax=Trichinella nativa TaxID=6335 RepID=A0A0V1KHY4_9BILA|nr:hypothetical protein T02_12061 [Trichinella nativa]